MSGLIYYLDINSLDSSEPLSSLDALIRESSESQEGNEIRLSGDKTSFSKKTYVNLIRLISLFQQNSINCIKVDHEIQYSSKSQSHKEWLAECTKAGIKFQKISIERSHRSSKRRQESQDPKAEESTVKPTRKHHSSARAEPVSRKSMSQRRHIPRVNLNIANLETQGSTQSIINDFIKFTIRSYVLFIFSENKIKQIDSEVYGNLYLLIKDANRPSLIIISPHIDFQSNQGPYSLLLSSLTDLNIKLVNHSSYNAIQSEKNLVAENLSPVERFMNK